MKSPFAMLLVRMLSLLILTAPIANAQWAASGAAPVSKAGEVVHGSLSEIRFRPFVFLRIRDREMLSAVERVIDEDPSGQLISVNAEADADFIVAFTNIPQSSLAKAGFMLPDASRIVSDHRGQMVVYTKGARGQTRIVWTDQKGSNRPERGMFEFLRTLEQAKQAGEQLPLKQLIAQIASTETDVQTISETADSPVKPTILYKERARYNEKARQKKIQGTVVLSVIYNSDGELSDLLVIKGLPCGMTARCVEAVKKIRFTPAMRDGKPVNVRGWMEFNFALY